MLFLKTYVKLASSENHDNEPKKTPATSIGRKIRSLTICPVLTPEKDGRKSEQRHRIREGEKKCENKGLRMFI
jgi:hypothetical protein